MNACGLYGAGLVSFPMCAYAYSTHARPEIMDFCENPGKLSWLEWPQSNEDTHDKSRQSCMFWAISAGAVLLTRV